MPSAAPNDRSRPDENIAYGDLHRIRPRARKRLLTGVYRCPVRTERIITESIAALRQTDGVNADAAANRSIAGSESSITDFLFRPEKLRRYVTAENRIDICIPETAAIWEIPAFDSES